MSIIEFLKARIAEDEAVALAATAGPWTWSEVEEPSLYSGDEPVISAYGMHTEGFVDAIPEDRAHIARWHPARVLSECAAKRAAVEIHREGVDPCDEHDAAFKSIPCDTIRAFAAVYKDHPDYQQEWAL